MAALPVTSVSSVELGVCPEGEPSTELRTEGGAGLFPVPFWGFRI